MKIPRVASAILSSDSKTFNQNRGRQTTLLIDQENNYWNKLAPTFRPLIETSMLTITLKNLLNLDANLVQALCKFDNFNLVPKTFYELFNNKLNK